ncbi:hypothetical protein JJB09_17145 [Rhizobium sp. KVB221]|uniref:Uncharacterized protein n=1 Tax=Rhizobium setariae TaxID=2801340 RepID=A0A936YS93_9HYPH|nr:hypothetical protein [Rhizobium setariae]MBL0373751.1 hypothetical protein [Rhizobium setariae]
MSTSLRLSAAAVSVIVISAVVGFELGAAMLPAMEVARAEISKGPGIASPASNSRENLKTRSIAGLLALDFAAHGVASANVAVANPIGPAPSDTRVAVHAMRSIVSACLIASN